MSGFKGDRLTMTLHSRSFATATQPITLGFLTPHNAHDPRAFSGTVYHAAQALRALDGVTLKPLGSHHRAPGLGNRIARRLGRKAASPRAPLTDALAGVDAVVGLVATDLLDRLPPVVPYLHVTDATPGFLSDAYGWDIGAETRVREARVAQAAAVCLYSSGMMAARARTELGIARADALPFGINLDLAPGSPIKKPPLGPVELLYVGADWTRKGGEIALAAFHHLQAQGLPAHLTCVGHIPEHVRQVPGVTVAGFLDKTRPRQARRLRNLYSRAHLLVLPTRGDCTPMVLAEAMAHGTPVLATDTGGIAEVIGQGGAGRTVPLEASPEIWARHIAGMTADAEAHFWMSDAASDRATRYSWDVWAEGIARRARESLTQTPARAA